MLTTLSLLGHRLEMRARFSTGKAVEALLRLAPATARVLRATSSSSSRASAFLLMVRSYPARATWTKR